MNAQTNLVVKAITPQATMSSLEIAKLTDKQHKHVIVDVESLLTYYQSIYSAEKSAQLMV